MCLGTAEAASDKLDAYTCKYVFHKPRFTANNLNAETKRYEGYNLMLRSHTKCADDNTKDFVVNFNLKCKADDDGKKITWTQTTDTCTWNFAAESKHGCQTMDLSFMKPLRMFTGAFEILFGLALCFAGARFLLYVLQFLAFLFVSGAVMGLGNVFLNLYSTNHVPLIATIVVALILGCVGGYFFKGFVKTWGVTLLALVGGVMVGMMVVSPFRMATWLKYTILVILGGVSAYFGARFDQQLKVLGTATIGAALSMHGLGAYLGGFPSLGNSTTQFKADWGYIAYFLGWIVFAVVGTQVQQRYTYDQTKDDVFA